MKAMILAAGRGERMRPLTDRTPKPLLSVGGQPLIVWHVKRLAAAGFQQVVINHAWLGEQIEAVLGDGRHFGVHIRYSAEGQALETAGGIRHALPLLEDGGRPAFFVVINGDIWTDYPLSALRKRRPRSAHLVLVNNPAHHREGDFGLEGSRVTATAPRLTYAGLGVYSSALFHSLPPGPAPLRPLLMQAQAEGHLQGEHYLGQWVDVGTPERLTALDRQLTEAAVPAGGFQYNKGL